MFASDLLSLLRFCPLLEVLDIHCEEGFHEDLHGPSLAGVNFSRLKYLKVFYTLASNFQAHFSRLVLPDQTIVHLHYPDTIIEERDLLLVSAAQ